VAYLNFYSDRPWMVLRCGKEVTERWLSQQLSAYGVRPRTLWIGDKSAKGCLEEDLTETFRRYIPRTMTRAFFDEMRAANAERAPASAKPAEPAPAPEPKPPGAAASAAALKEQLRWLRQVAAAATKK
jgi:hypothetical protein